MNLKKCVCGNELLFQIVPQVTNINDFRVWKPGEVCIAECRSTPVFLCISCGRYVLPATSLAGKNRLDEEYIIYEKLLNITGQHNKRIDSQNATDLKCGELELRCIQNEKVIEDLRENIYNLNKALDEITKEESKEQDVDSGSGSGEPAEAPSKQRRKPGRPVKNNKK